MAEVRFVRNPRFTTELQRDPEFVAFMRRTTDNLKNEVQRVAPRHTGYYARHVETVFGAGEYIVASKDAFGHLVEFGCRNNPAYAPLRRGVRAAGLRLDETLR